MYAHNDALQFSDKLTKLLGTHGMKFGLTLERGQKQQNFQNHEAGQLWFGTDNNTGTGNSAADMLAGRIGQFNQGTAPGQPGAGPAVRRVPLLGRRRVRAGQLEAPAEPDARIRRALRQLDEQPGTERSGRLLRPGALRPDARDRSSIPARSSASTACATSTTGCAPAGILAEPLAAFALPRVNVAWDIDGQGNNVLRGGYGHVLQPQHGQRGVRQHAAPGAERLPASKRTSGPAAATATAPG